jgi:hypothetical protein
VEIEQLDGKFILVFGDPFDRFSLAGNHLDGTITGRYRRLLRECLAQMLQRHLRSNIG